MSSTNRQLFQDLISRTRLAAALPPVSESATGLDSAVVDTHGTSSGGGLSNTAFGSAGSSSGDVGFALCTEYGLEDKECLLQNYDFNFKNKRLILKC